jgi:hypothetical protein
MKKVKRFLLSLSMALSISGVWAQGFFEGVSVKAGFSSFAPDDRTFPFAPWLDEWFASTSYSNDKEYCLFFEKRILQTGKFESGIGIGYSLRRSNFPTVINQFYFHDFFHLRGYIVKEYYMHSALLPFSSSYCLIETTQSKLSVGVFVINVFSFRKDLQSLFGVSEKFSKTTFELKNIELNPNLSYRFRGFHASIGYRLVNFNRPDRAIFSVYNLPNSIAEINSESSYDFYNPTKIWLILGYDLFPRDK